MSSHLFSPITLRGLTLDDRIAVSAMCQYQAEDGNANDWHLMHYGSLSMGAGGLLITEATHVSPEGRISPKCLGLYSDENEAAIKRFVDFCKTYGTAKLGIQIAHSGRKGSTQPPGKGGKPIAIAEGGWETVAPSGLGYADWPAPRGLDDAGLAKVKAEFVATTKRADRVGFDLAELHGGHGYLLHQFVSPLSNQRTDGYGGSLENRLRFPLEVFEACRAVWPDDKPFAVRFSATDWVDGGFSPEEAVAYAKELKALGCDFIDVTSGGLDPRQKIEVKPGYQVFLAEKIKKETGIATMAVGMIVTPQQAEKIVADGEADMIALARGVMDDPRWAWHAAQALGETIAYPAQYARCAPGVWPGAEWKDAV
ncbi:NADH:flavin oxidoreductase/NADH oxidase [Nisaea sediminum]|uniref:NADH:flavin oxidoreductase/NADH oxidase n=1 Tax=Nisaea sediminum TaxID=2775867 RepID=UPI00186795ED|nr:NADH:flavin oxidoreductase/NADH oxidase [Nisaea sediminum]